jgi:hypothetical protein
MDRTELDVALERIAKLEEELNDRDRQLEAIISDHDQDIVDLRKSFEMEAFKKPPLHPNTLRQSTDSLRQSFSGHNENETVGNCQECVRLKKQLHQYQKQWKEMSKHFRQVPTLLEGMIKRTDTLVNNITRTEPTSR